MDPDVISCETDFCNPEGSSLYARGEIEHIRHPCSRLTKSNTSELRFFYQDGASHLFPDAWYAFSPHSLSSSLDHAISYREDYLAPIPEAERHDMVLAYHAQLNSEDDEVRIRAAKAWSKWEYALRVIQSDVAALLRVTRFRMSTSKLYVDPAHIAEAEKDDWAK